MRRPLDRSVTVITLTSVVHGPALSYSAASAREVSEATSSPASKIADPHEVPTRRRAGSPAIAAFEATLVLMLSGDESTANEARALFRLAERGPQRITGRQNATLWRYRTVWPGDIS